MTQTTDPWNDSADAPTENNGPGEPLTHNGPGWMIERDDFDLICWAPNETVDDGHTGHRRTAWMISVEAGPRPSGANSHRPSSGFATGRTLAEILPALALLQDDDRAEVIEVLFRQLGGHSS